MTRELSRLLRPKSMAVIGGGWGLSVVEQALKAGFQGEIWPVHPSRREIHGLPCYPDLKDLPSAPDATFIAVNRHLAVDVVAKLSAMGAGGAVCFASGFAEAEDGREAGADLQARLIEAAGDMPVLGPNCYGFINYLDGALLWPDQHGGKRVGQGVAILGQSSNMLINLTMQRRALPVAYVMAAGNQAQIGLAEMAMSVMEDERVTAIGLHIEGVSDTRAFEAMAARARALRKPLVALKVGRSEQAQAATISHTASLAGSDAASRAFLDGLGIAQLNTLPEFLETLKLLHVHGPLPGRSLSSMSCSGGEASLVADAATVRRVAFRKLTLQEHDRIKGTLSDLVTVANPLDYHTFIWDDTDRMAATYSAVLSCGFDLTFLIYDFPRADRCSTAAWDCGVDAITQAVRQTHARAAVVSSLPENMPEERAEALLAEGIAPVMGLEEALAAAEAAADISDYFRRTPALAVLAPACLAEESAKTLDEAAAKKLLASCGVVIPDGRAVTNCDQAAVAAEELGYPVVLKGLGFAHKTEAGAVRLGLTSSDDVLKAAREMQCSGFLVEQMVAAPVAELIVGVVRDPVYGFTLTIGAGGILAELLSDTATLLVPASTDDIRNALCGLRIWPVLSGYRGRPAADLEAIIDAVMSVQRFVQEHAASLVELDINPLLVTPHDAIAVDALVRMT